MNSDDYIKREAKHMANNMIKNYMAGLRIAKVNFQGDKTTVKWGDNSETSVICSKGDTYDAEKAVAFCVAKKIYGSKFKKFLKNLADGVIGEKQ